MPKNNSREKYDLMETIGNKLKAAREKTKMTRADVAKATLIKTSYIEAIENNDFEKLIAPVYAKGFIKIYAQCVQIDPASLLRQFNALEHSDQSVPVMREPHEKKEKKDYFFKKLRLVFANYYSALLDAFKGIKLPELSRLNIPSFRPVAVPAKKLMMIMTLAVVCVIIFYSMQKHVSLSNARLKVPPACRWIADPPEPYLNIVVQKTPNSH